MKRFDNLLLMNGSNIFLMPAFPDFSVKGFDIDQYNKRFVTDNVIIRASAHDVAYPEHWGPLSLKYSFTGKEMYRVGSRVYAVDNAHILLLNEGTWYSSYIHSKKSVQSFTLNFAPAFVKEMLPAAFRFEEKLYAINKALLQRLHRVYLLSENFAENSGIIEELLYDIFAQMVLQQENVNREIEELNYAKHSTRKEIYKRLHTAKDYMDSCYAEPVDLQQLSSLTCMNKAYFLRQFKQCFKISPRQYLIKKRMEAAMQLLKAENCSITEVCHEVGYSDLTSFGKLFRKFFHTSPEIFQQSSR